MLFLGPNLFSPKPLRMRHNKTEIRAHAHIRRTLLGITTTAGQHANITHSLAHIPSYQLINNLHTLFRNPVDSIQRGIFRRIVSDTIDLPPARAPPNPENANLWINRLPSDWKQMFTTSAHSTFITPLLRVLSYSPGEPQLPKPAIHATHSEYAKLVDKAELAGILSWSIVDQETHRYTRLAQALQMTLFAVTKSGTRTRLISWPRTQNCLLPDPPHTPIPDPSLFDTIVASGTSKSAFYLDISNMFHNITLPHWLAELLPWKPISLRELHPDTVSRIAARLDIQRLSDNSLLRPLQATMPMGFKWAVFVAHNFVADCLQQSYHLFRSSRFAPPGLSSVITLARSHAPCSISSLSPLLMHIIDDVAAIAIDWHPQAVTTWYRITRRILLLSNLLLSSAKSSPYNHIESCKVDFIGCQWNLHTDVISISPDKLPVLLQQIDAMLQSESTTKQDWERLLGKIIWFTTLNRPLLACAQAVFHECRNMHTNISFRISDAAKRELRTIAGLLPLARITTQIHISQIVIAFDASLTAGAVTFTNTTPQQAFALWKAVTEARFGSQELHHDLHHVKAFVYRHHWKKALIHYWLKPDHINSLEASTCVLAMEWAIRTGIHNSRLILLTDSLATLGSMRKGRSSAPALLARCRRLAALALAHNIRLTFAYIRSSHNPADKFTRL